MPTINLRASATVSLPAGSWIVSTGTGVAVLGPGEYRNQQFPLQGTRKVGPFPFAVDVYISSTDTAITYTVERQSVAPLITRNASEQPTGLIDPLTGQAVGGAIAATKVQVSNRAGTPNLVQANTGTAGQTGKGNLQYGNCGLKTAPISGAGSGMTPGEYPLTISGGTPTTAATGTYTVGAGGTCTGVTITFPGIGYNTAPTVAAGGSPGGTLPTFTSTIGNTAQEFNSFQSVTITEDCTDLDFTFANFAANASAPGQTDAGPSTLTLRVGARVVGVATTYPLFSQRGGRDIVMEPDEDATTKPIPGPFKKGDVVMLQVYGRYASIPANWPVSTGMWQSRGDEVAEFGTNLTDHSLRTSTIGGAVHSSNWAICPPIEVRGRVLTNTNKRLALFGDSIATSGANDSGSGGYIGFFQRAVAANYGFVNLGASGYGVTAFMTSSRAARMRKYRALAESGITHAFTNWVTNDLSGAASAAVVTTILTNLNALRDELLAFGIKLIVMTCCPRTNTNNDGVNAADNAGAWGYRRTFNDAIRASNGVGFGYFDLALYTQDPVNLSLQIRDRHASPHPWERYRGQYQEMPGPVLRLLPAVGAPPPVIKKRISPEEAPK